MLSFISLIVEKRRKLRFSTVSFSNRNSFLAVVYISIQPFIHREIVAMLNHAAADVGDRPTHIGGIALNWP